MPSVVEWVRACGLPPAAGISYALNTPDWLLVTRIARSSGENDAPTIEGVFMNCSIVYRGTGRDGRAQQTLDPKLRDGCPRVGEATREHLVKHDAQCTDVARGTQRIAQQLVWAHVGQGARLEPVGCQELGHLVGDAEVEHLHVAPWTQHDVLRLEVAVENADPVHMVQRVSHDAQHTYGLR